MKWRFSWIYRLRLVLLAVALFWSVWASAQPVTNSVPAAGTNAPTTNSPRIVEWKAMTVGLDQVGYLQQTIIFGQSAWKYLASAIYVLLAFVVAWLFDAIVKGWLKQLAAKTVTK
jgi:hypothetical protein